MSSAAMKFLRRLAPALALLGATLPTAAAQRFVFVSTRAPEADFVAYDRPWQSEVFLYRDGSELRLTHTPHASEYDPVAAPGGRLVAYVALDHADEAAGHEGWPWYLAVLDTLTGREVARWDLPNSTGGLRPAGGFGPTWLEEGVLLAQVPSAVGEWEVHRFDVGSGGSQPLAAGFGIVLAPDGRSFATGRGDGVHVHHLDGRGESLVFPGAGAPLAWWRGRLFVAHEGGLALVDPAAGASEDLTAGPGYVTELRVDAAGDRYAYLALDGAAGGGRLVVSDAEHEVLLERAVGGWPSGLDWLDRDRLVLAVESPDGDVHVEVVDLAGNSFAVDSVGADHSPRAVR